MNRRTIHLALAGPAVLNFLPEQGNPLHILSERPLLPIIRGDGAVTLPSRFEPEIRIVPVVDEEGKDQPQTRGSEGKSRRPPRRSRRGKAILPLARPRRRSPRPAA
jgi:hypothetical protein